MVRFLSLAECPGLTYLQRMNFIQHWGIDLPEEFTRRDGSGRFVEITRIGRGGEINSGPIATKVAECIVPDLAMRVRSGSRSTMRRDKSRLASNGTSVSDKTIDPHRGIA